LNVKLKAIGVLAAIGTKEVSVPALEAQSKVEKQRIVQMNITQAVAAINARAAAPK
jgi:hypothetical protein